MDTEQRIKELEQRVAALEGQIQVQQIKIKKFAKAQGINITLELTASVDSNIINQSQKNIINSISNINEKLIDELLAKINTEEFIESLI